MTVLGPSTGEPNTNERCDFYEEANDESLLASGVGSDRVDVGGGARPPGKTVGMVECYYVNGNSDRIDKISI